MGNDGGGGGGERGVQDPLIRRPFHPPLMMNRFNSIKLLFQQSSNDVGPVGRRSKVLLFNYKLTTVVS